MFAVNTNGTGFTTLYSFSALGTNSDGTGPYGGLILSGNTLYGTAYAGASLGFGTVFAVNTDGTGFRNLHSFTWSDGALPYGGLVLSNNTLYGMADAGGSSFAGTVFKVNTNGTGFRNLHNFSGDSDKNPGAGLILSGNTLYGTAFTVFAVNTDGTRFTNLYNVGSQAGLILSGNILYGTTEEGGSSGNGTVFSLSFTPQLTIVPSGTNVILTWPTNVAGFDYTGFTLKSTTNLVSPALWTTNSPPPVLVNGQNTVTNPISGAQQFYRLSH